MKDGIGIAAGVMCMRQNIITCKHRQAVEVAGRGLCKQVASDLTAAVIVDYTSC